MTITAPEWTVLRLTGMGVVPYSTRAAKQTLSHIGQSQKGLYRDVNGVLRNVGGTQFQKYASTISCSDIKPFASDGVWPGKQVTVSCISELSYLTAGGSPARDVVSGSSYTEGDWTFYRPELVMLVMSFNIDRDEYGDETSWSMQLEEV